MKRYDNDLIETIRNKADLLELMSDYTRLDSGRKGHWAICPFHGERTASLHLEPRKGVYYCHGCQAKGDIFTVPMVLDGLSFGESVRHVAERFGVPVEDADVDENVQLQYRMRRALELAEEHFHNKLWCYPDKVEAFEKRGVSVEMMKEWRLGYSPRGDSDLIQSLRKAQLFDAAIEAGIIADGQHGPYSKFSNRLVFPIKSKTGKTVTFAGRSLDPNAKAKYINGKETSLYNKSSTLFGLHKSLKGIRENDSIIIVEGYFDAILMHREGYTETVATCGTALTKEMVKSFYRLTKKAVVFFDSDPAGKRAAIKALPVFAHYGVDATRAYLEDGTDPADVCVSRDADTLIDSLENDKPLMDIWLHDLSSSFPKTPSGRQEAALAVKPVVNSYKGVAKDMVLRSAANVLGVSPEALKGLVSQARVVDMDKPQERKPDPLAMALARVCIAKPAEVPEIKSKIKYKWFDGDDERSLMRLLLNGTPIHEAARKAATFLQGPLLQLAVSNDEKCCAKQTISRLELRSIERELPTLNGRERLDAQRKRLKLQWSATH